jgi:PhnB protein
VNCEEAIRCYERVFSTEAQEDYVYHAEMTIPGQRFMFSDIIEFEVTAGISAFFVATFDAKEEVEAAYRAMLPVSRVLVPLRSATYSSAAANLVDKFGIRWGLMTEQVDR